MQKEGRAGVNANALERGSQLDFAIPWVPSRQTPLGPSAGSCDHCR
jgi:hypothetical protein